MRVPRQKLAPSSRRWLGALLAVVVSVLATVPVSAVNILGCEFANAADLVRKTRLPGFRVLDTKGNFVAGLRNYYSRHVAEWKLPRHLVNALVAQEDKRFFEHAGVDWRGLARAAIENVRQIRFAQGGSTLTMQALKNTCFRHDPTFWRKVVRKFEEYGTAPFLEIALDKQDILEVYLNSIFFGGTGASIRGVQAAARVYFDKYAEELTPLESAALVQLIPAPNRYSGHENLVLAKKRAMRVLDRMVEERRLTANEAKKAKAQKLAFTVPQVFTDHQGNKKGPPGFYRLYYHDGGPQVGWFAQWAREQSDKHFHSEGGVVTVGTTLRPEIQEITERELGQALRHHGKAARFDQGAALVMSHSGEVLAMVGGRDFRKSRWNIATQAQRQPGSAFKLFVYLAALERGLTPTSPVEDTRLDLPSGTTIHNHDGVYRGRSRVSEALAYSSNTAAMRLAIGHVPEVIDVARRLGITSLLTSEVGLALGVSEVSLLELTAAYAGIANGGRRVTPETVREIRDNEDRTVWCRESRALPRVISAAHASAMTTMLREAVRKGTGKRAAPGLPAAGKTGTTDGFRDAWFVGFTDRFVVGVWLGNERATPMKDVTGGGLPAEIWKGIVKRAHALPPLKATRTCKLENSAAIGPSLP